MFAATLVTVVSRSSATFLRASTTGAVNRCFCLLSISSHGLGLGPVLFIWKKKYDFIKISKYFNVAIFDKHQLHS